MLALIAGQGALPVRLAATLSEAGTPFRLCELEGFPSDVIGEAHRFRVEQLGTFLATLHSEGIQDVCFAGAIRRPPLDPSAVDAATMPLVPRMMQALQAGDDAALRIVLTFFEEAGLTVRAAQEIAPDLLPSAGVLTTAEPSDRDKSDAGRAADIHAALSAADIGQALAVASGQALAVEATGGTDWMLATLDGDRRPPSAPGGILFKAPKEGQDRRIDLPTIGPETVAGAAAAGLSGIVIEAGGVLVIDVDATVAAADAAGVFLWVRSP